MGSVVYSQIAQNRVERAEGISAAEFRRRYVARGLPVIFTDLLTAWRARQTWSRDFFEERFGDRLVGGRGTCAEMTLGEGIRKIRASLHTGEVAPYIHQLPIPTQLPEIIDDMSPFIPYAAEDRMRSPLMPRTFRYREGSVELFIGGPKAGFSLLHYDLYHQHVFIAQVVGHKIFRMFAPSDTLYLYPDADHPHASGLNDAFDVDLGRFPAFAGASPIDFVLDPGEVLFVPAGWWHATRMEEVTISVARNTLDRYSWPGFVADYRRGVWPAGVGGRLRAAYVSSLGNAFLALGR
jgi:histone arginine demethylase JMJD6